MFYNFISFLFDKASDLVLLTSIRSVVCLKEETISEHGLWKIIRGHSIKINKSFETLNIFSINFEK